MDKREAASVVAVIAAAYPQWPASKETVAVYADALADLSHADAMAAVRDLILTEDRWPTVATIRRRAADRAGILAPTSTQAWAEVVGQADEQGRYGQPRWTHPAIREAVKAVGWYEICMSTNQDTLRAQFMRMYDDIRSRHDVALLTEPGRLSLGSGSADRGGTPALVAYAE